MVQPFADLAEFMALPRVGGLALSPDGSRLVTAVGQLDPKKTKWQNALWSIDPNGERPARRLTRGASGEGGAVFLPNGDLLFVAPRPDPSKTDGDDQPPAALWRLPADGGEAVLVTAPPGGVAGIAVAKDSGAFVVVSPVHAGADLHAGDEFGEAERERRKQRKEAGVTAILHDEYPVRYWDHDLGPAWPRLLFGQVDDPAGDTQVELRDLTPDAGLTIGDASGDIDITADGTTIVRTDNVPAETGAWRSRIELIDTATGDRRVLADDPAGSFGGARFSPDGSRIVCSFGLTTAYDQPPVETTEIIDVASGERRRVAPHTDRWFGDLTWAPDGDTLFAVADEDGAAPVFRIDLGEQPDSDEVTRLTGAGAHNTLRLSSDGSVLYALRSAWDEAPQPVRLDTNKSSTGQHPEPLPNPSAGIELPGTLERIETTAADGTRIPSWIVLPDGASADSPAPFVLWAHGGPLGSWNAWSWRWSPWLLAARGYAVLLPDPAFSTGYGQEFIDRGWGDWGGAPYTDLMAAVDAALERPDIDADRTAMMGGSFGGYMANWIATQTDRFRAIVTHASLWHLDGFVGATDVSFFWEREFGDPRTQNERYASSSPHLFADNITTPMLVIHGDKDYRVPIGEGLRLWYDLQRRGVPSKFLYYPDENHWILTPGNHTVWYETVFAFLAEHVLDEEWQQPELL